VCQGVCACVCVCVCVCVRVCWVCMCVCVCVCAYEIADLLCKFARGRESLHDGLASSRVTLMDESHMNAQIQIFTFLNVYIFMYTYLRTDMQVTRQRKRTTHMDET